MGQRLDLQDLLVAIPGVAKVYFQPPSGLMMEYPCIVYELSNVQISHADNRPYNGRRRYQVTVVDANPDSSIPFEVEQLPSVQFDRFYTAKNLNHFSYEIYF